MTNAIKFIKDHGVEKAREVIGKHAECYMPEVFKYWSEQLQDYVLAPKYASCLVADLKRLVDSVDLINSQYGGLENAKELMLVSPKLTDELRFLGQAIADYEAIYPNDIKIEVSFGVSLMSPERVACVDLMPKPAFNLETLRDCDTSPNCKKFDEQVK